MILAGRPAKILLIDTNVYFSKRLSDALKREGFEVNCSTQPSFALTNLEYDPPTAIVCSTSMREMGALDIARLIRADAKNSSLPVIALGDGGQRALMEAFQAGCDDYIDRTRPPAVIATHVRNIIISKAEGFQPTQMLAQADTSLSGSLTHHDLPGVMQMLGHAHQTGALHINSGETDALLFFDAGTITHAECGSLFGDEAVIHILQSCMRNNSGGYKFAYGSSSARHTVLRSATDLMLDAMREMDESLHQSQQDEPGTLDASPEESPFAPLLGLADSDESQESAAIASAIDDFAQSSCSENPASAVLFEPTTSAEREQVTPPPADGSESNYVFETPAPDDAPSGFPAETHTESVASAQSEPDCTLNAEPFANYSIVPYAGNDIEDIT
jgi:CheY-like chemotaxis protein